MVLLYCKGVTDDFWTRNKETIASESASYSNG